MACNRSSGSHPSPFLLVGTVAFEVAIEFSVPLNSNKQRCSYSLPYQELIWFEEVQVALRNTVGVARHNFRVRVGVHHSAH